MAEEDLDLVLHLGDYIYETGPAHRCRRAGAHDARGRRSREPADTLADYRNRHAQYKTDRGAAGRARRGAVGRRDLDDHDVENNYAGDHDATRTPTRPCSCSSGRRRTARSTSTCRCAAKRCPSDPTCACYRRLRFGDLLDLHMLDSRQYRTDQPDDLATPEGRKQAPRDFRPGLPPGGNAGGTLLGAEQERWLLDGLRQSPTRWNALGNQVMMAEFNFGRYETPANGGPLSFNVDSWDGYSAERSRILAAAAERRDLNLVVLTGDAHSAWVHDLRPTSSRRAPRSRRSSSVPRSPRPFPRRCGRRRRRRRTTRRGRTTSTAGSGATHSAP